jgi:hypothetical protein
LLVAVVVQFLLAGLGIFADAYFFRVHAGVNAAVIGLLPLALVAIGAFGGVDRRTLLMTAGIFGLVVVQSILLIPYRSGVTGPLRLVSGLHAVNALVIFWLGLELAQRTMGRRGGLPHLPSGGR